jgi:hypothetical protein
MILFLISLIVVLIGALIITTIHYKDKAELFELKFTVLSNYIKYQL